MTGRFTIVKDPKVSKGGAHDAAGNITYFRKIDLVPDIEIDLSCPETLSDIDDDGNEENFIYGDYHLNIEKPVDLNIDDRALPPENGDVGNKQQENEAVNVEDTAQDDQKDVDNISGPKYSDHNFDIDWQEDSDPFVWPDLGEEEILGIDLTPTENFTALLEHPKSKLSTKDSVDQNEVESDRVPVSDVLKATCVMKEDVDDSFAIVPDIYAPDDEARHEPDAAADARESDEEEEDECSSIYDESDSGPEDPERLIDSCYVGDHIVPYLEEQELCQYAFCYKIVHVLMDCSFGLSFGILNS